MEWKVWGEGLGGWGRRWGMGWETEVVAAAGALAGGGSALVGRGVGAAAVAGVGGVGGERELAGLHRGEEVEQGRGLSVSVEAGGG